MSSEADRTGGRAHAAHQESGRHTVRQLALERRFFLFWSGQAISKTGNGIYQIGLAWACYQITNSTAALGLVLALNFVPQLALVLMGGAVSDRVSRRIVVLSADSAATVVTAGLVVASATHQLSTVVLAAGSFLLGVCSAFYDPAYAAMNRDLLPEQDLQGGNSILTISTNAARVLGPAIGGLAFGFGGATLLFGLDSASFAIAVLAMACIRVRPRKVEPADDATDGLFAGVKYTFRTRWLLVISAMTVVANCACLAPFRVLLPALVKSAHSGAATLGVLNAAEVAATVVGVILVRNLRIGPRSMLTLAVMAGILALGTCVLAFSGLTPVALIAGPLLIGGGLAFNVIETTLLQTRVPAGLLSRVFSVNLLLSFSLLPLGYALSGFLARLAGPPVVLAAGGLALLAVCVWVPFVKPERGGWEPAHQ